MKREEGAITIFLSLILIIMLSIVATTVEAARINTSKMYVERALNTAMNSVLAQYDTELKDQYSLMTLDAGYGKNTIDTTQMINQMNHYLQHSLNPQKDLQEPSIFHKLIHTNNQQQEQFIDLYRFNIKDIQIENYTSLIDEQTEIFKYQILENMKYKGPMLLIEGFLDKLELISKSSKTAQVVQDKAEVDDKVSEFGSNYLDLMSTIDGTSFKKETIHTDRNNNILMNHHFVKQLSTQHTQEDRLTNNAILNQAIAQKQYTPDKEEVINLLTYALIERVTFYQLEEEIESIKEEIGNLNSKMSRPRRRVSTLERDIRALISDINKAEDESSVESLIRTLEKKEKELSSEKKELNKRQDQKDDLELKRKDLENQKDKAEEGYFDNLLTYELAIEELMLTLSEIESKNRLGLKQIGLINEDLEYLKKEINTYETLLNNNKEGIIPQTYVALEQDLKDLKQSLNIQENGQPNLNLLDNIPAMEEALTKNLDILIQEEIDALSQYYDDALYQQIDNKAKVLSKSHANIGTGEVKAIEQIKDLLLYYDKINGYGEATIQYLQFDYSDFNLEGIDQEVVKTDPRDNEDLKNQDQLIQSGISDYLQDNKGIDPTQLPSTLLEQEKQKDQVNEVTFNDRSFAKKALDLLVGFGESIGNQIRDLPEQLLINEYIIGHFATAVDHLDSAEDLTLTNYKLTDHYLDYEVEYIIEGQLKEEDNLKGVSSKIVTTRFGLNLIHILSDPVKRQITFNMAAAIIGWSPLAFLVYMVQFLLMSAWSYAESHIDLRLLLKGEAVVFIKTKKDWILDETGIKHFVIDTVTEQATEYANEKIQQIVDKTNRMIEEFGQDIDESLQNYASDTIGTVFNEAYRMQEEATDYMDQKIEEVINTHITAIMNGTDSPHMDVEILYDHQGNDLVQDITQAINAEKNTIIEGGITHAIEVKESVYKAIEEQTAKAKEKVEQTVENAIQTSINEVKNTLQDEVSNIGETAQQVTKNTIDDISKHLKDTINTHVNESVSTDVIKNEEDNVLGKMNVTFSYKDYLRLFLMVNVNEKTKLARTLDCIQMNGYDTRGEDYTLQQQLYAYHAKAIVEMDYIFFNFPFMPEYIKNFGKNKRTITVELSQSY
ncbi:hypothetical protein EDC19_1283 [Natranaerovirga hydrolytica]|uniref:Uncharacterized protein n=1 Tax=Natranaerovirga hydrolytica TaxID=680378 RepID=A0A4R1MKU0_9FIRM|nr:DUF5702 domain-containing protein [Natranaerovirga hydrolytica]TCK93105.1 hypothetical protein EDC19_1283 [Natranaerovirga hydrolytica]